MADQWVQSFMDALREVESSGDVESMARLFGEDSRLGNVAATREFEGPDGARAFWRIYRGNFRQVASEFKRVIATEDAAALEWESRGLAANGEPFFYEGVTLLEAQGGEIARFFSYFDPARLGLQIQPRRGAEGVPEGSAAPSPTY